MPATVVPACAISDASLDGPAADCVGAAASFAAGSPLSAVPPRARPLSAAPRPPSVEAPWSELLYDGKAAAAARSVDVSPPVRGVPISEPRGRPGSRGPIARGDGSSR